MATIKDFSGYTPTWCPGCGDWSIGMAIKKALVEMGYGPWSVAVVFGIGCSGNMNDFLNAYAIHSLHGRAIPNAIGIKIANHQMPVIAIVGDGDCYGEGGNHLVHACRGNHDITVIVHDNGVYGLTTGQVAPTAAQGMKSKSTPEGIIERPINPLSLALSQGATFVAQAFAGKVPQMVELIKEGIRHRGFSLINILQPCVTFNKINTYQYYLKRIFDLDGNYWKHLSDSLGIESAKDNSYNKADLEQALLLVNKSYQEEKFPIGVIYQVKRPVYTDFLSQLDERPLVKKERFKDFRLLLKEFY